MKRIYNFSAGPAMLPLEVLEEVKEEMLDFQDSGMSILEMSHRSPIYEKVNAEAEADIKELLGLGDDYCVLFLGGGGSLQFSMVAMNFLTQGKKGGYVVTSTFSDKAMQEAKKVGETCELFSSKEQKYNRVPQLSELSLSEDLAYVHITGNNTIEGTEFSDYPDTGNIPLIADLSSDILSKPIPAEKFSLIYAGAQKNIGPGGVVVVIARKSFLAGRDKSLPSMLNYEIHMKNNSLYNTPPVFGVYIVGKVAKWLKAQGGLAVMAERNEAKAKIVYDVIDSHPEFFRGFADKDSRSLMNVTFGLSNAELEKQFLMEATAIGLDGLQGHRSVGGLRASIYNAMPEAGCKKLADFMEEFYLKNI